MSAAVIPFPRPEPEPTLPSFLVYRNPLDDLSDEVDAVPANQLLSAALDATSKGASADDARERVRAFYFAAFCLSRLAGEEPPAEQPTVGGAA
jgi:hypothetical protein